MCAENYYVCRTRRCGVTCCSSLSVQGITYDTGGADIKAGGVMAGMHRCALYIILCTCSTYIWTYICTYVHTRSTVCTHVWHQLPFRDPLHGHAQHLTNECSSKQWRVCSRTLAVSRCLQLLFLLLNVVRRAARCLGLSTCRDKGGASAVAGVFKVRTYVCTYVVSMPLTNACVCVCMCACICLHDGLA